MRLQDLSKNNNYKLLYKLSSTILYERLRGIKELVKKNKKKQL